MTADIRLTRRRLLGGTAVVAGGALLGPVTGPLPMPSAQSAPRLYTRAAWHARAPKKGPTVLNRRPDHIVVHHTATANSADTSTKHAAALSRSIQKFHMDTNGWEDIGQQLTISRGGHLMEGHNGTLTSIRDDDLVVGAHTLGHNDHTIGIENEGTYMTERPTGALWDTLVETCTWLCAQYDLNPHSAIVGHRDYNKTSCPGDVLYARLPGLRNAVADMLGIRRVPEEPVEPSGLPGPRFTFDHGPAADPG
ncbi:N-acetylmuramoyl-L-alanine amidase [Actinomadura graeca]|uniref:N-acetylmuramoyl-L-alanine amidase n=1 Tax=Actinomadura graeca TaxID=2750812 RepID=A0ABX8QU07_9ACTN|nr:peptidoglycan recognition family protein [Actinomadura graeca]QXJ21851.1 N-acetylmuramoyl-L-alanine amidase [Actinomadura graeca]